jgi:hypothetical protein
LSVPTTRVHATYLPTGHSLLPGPPHSNPTASNGPMAKRFCGLRADGDLFNSRNWKPQLLLQAVQINCRAFSFEAV